MNELVKRILVGVSCDPGATDRVAIGPTDRHAFEHASWLARAIDAELRVIHVVDHIDERLASDPVVASNHEREIEHAMALLCEGSNAQRVTRRGRAWEELIAEARSFSADLIVIAPRREAVRFGDRLLHGSTAARVLRRASTAVWVVAPDATIPFERVLALVDGSAASAAILETAEALAMKFGLERHVMRCLDYPEDIVMHRLPHPQEAIARYHDSVRSEARNELEALISDAWKVHLGDDWVVREAPKLVEREKIDLIVLSTGQRAGLAGMLGLTAEKLLERSGVSAWVVRPPPS
jgi:nucleotide-binding universal stress UspA family protein